MIEPSSRQNLFIANRPLVEGRNRAAQLRETESNLVANPNLRAEEGASTRNPRRVDPIRVVEEVQRSERNSPRVRRDDNSDLPFPARQALAQFNQIENSTLDESAPNFAGVDLFV